MTDRYLPALDGLRACAVMSVMIVHAEVPHMYGAGIGVYVFFTLSGFLITGLLLDEVDAGGRIALGAFYARRALRLLPALLLLVVGVTTWALVFAEPASAREDLTATPWVLGYLANWRRALAGHDLAHYGHTWSLSIEEQFYLVWPLLLIWLLVRRRRSARVVAGVAVALSIAVLVNRLVVFREYADYPRFNGTDFIADQILLGCALAVLVREARRTALRAAQVERCFRATFWPAVLALLGFVVFAPAGDPLRSANAAIGSFHPTWIAVASCLVIGHLATAPGGLASRLLARGPLVVAGRISYGLYLFHYPVFLFVAERSGLSSRPLRWLVQFALAGVIAAASYCLLERPLLRLKSHFPPAGVRREADRAAAATAVGSASR